MPPPKPCPKCERLLKPRAAKQALFLEPQGAFGTGGGRRILIFSNRRSAYDAADTLAERYLASLGSEGSWLKQPRLVGEGWLEPTHFERAYRLELRHSPHAGKQGPLGSSLEEWVFLHVVVGEERTVVLVGAGRVAKDEQGTWHRALFDKIAQSVSLRPRSDPGEEPAEEPPAKSDAPPK